MCKHLKKIRSNQPVILCTELSKTQLLPVSIAKYTSWYVIYITDVIKSKINFKISRSPEKFLFKLLSLTFLTHCRHILQIHYGHLSFSTRSWYNVSLKASSFIISSDNGNDGDFRNYISLPKRKGPMFFRVWFYFCLNNCCKRFFAQAHRPEVVSSFKTLFRWSCCNNLWINKPLVAPHYELMTLYSIFCITLSWWNPANIGITFTYRSLSYLSISNEV